MIIGILAPMKEELQAICDKYPQSTMLEKCGIHYHYIKIKDNEIIIMQCGVGKVNAALAVSTIKHLFNVDIIINLGSAGGMKLGQKPLDIVIGTELVYTDVDITPLGFAYGELLGEPKSWFSDKELVSLATKCSSSDLPTIHYGTIGTSDAFVSAPMVQSIQNKFDNRIVCAEMEGCAVAHSCTKLGIRFIVIRSLSDVPSEDGKSHEKMMDYLSRASHNASILVSRIIEQLIVN
ncbi:MTA/SAH nucleosidase, putative [Entamoeba histolytica HM-1:IMSS-B]|uniref:adenosylhomocysteine nucleosidase n=6 Tax=Entamoeba histolytica TaxID=5759 RepID=C4LZC1_ENTH1|nr:MTA/SAH nucleosidase, putative [Entamoeba histolytica HM-1:IMSS]EMD46034.1 MTA/SAH nucleosidase, putative [Entamoeba histolytica KU27]EMH72383.1 MTA/SAH nucleosidase, putative [Entamoeba histolytica HM-1:IMSS-B]EMS13133.1 MTA/SAH nucleosidase [Entamoeba histolytica HM-3:IMSS]ENY65747.1 MTA/SAH nucleosidase, putative [Entamoeba histolytica HM-1:IMSS-A]GAT94204.1 mta sah nucleosidase putative [Entamoeba histolytica]|eukprot:XP_653171.1 MTA/SAH nucleosidase, putative [Entamoeba histolytica HM-1:IMSS]